MDAGSTLFVVVLVIVIVGLVIWIATISRRARRISDASDARLAAALQDVANNPPTKTFDQETPAERSADVIAMARDDDETPAQAAAVAAATKESRLEELADLNARGLISAEELAVGRAKIIAE